MKAIFKSLLIVVGLPTLIASIYFGLFASDVFVSEARFSVRSTKGGGVVSGLAAIIASPGTAGTQDSMIVSDYVHSQDMLAYVQSRLDFRAHYSDDHIDVLSRLDEEATAEQTLDYFRTRVDLMRDSTSDVITLKARAYDPAMAQKLAQTVIERSEALVNEMSSRIEDDALQSARSELELAVVKLRTASGRLTSYRNVNVSINPAEESSALLGLVSGIETRLIETRTELNEKKAFMRATSPEVITLENRVKALSRQLSLEKGRLVGDSDGQQMSGLIEGYEPLVLEQEIAQQQYGSALKSLELARIEAQRKKQYLITFISPNLPDQALEPERLAKVLTVMVFSFLAYLIGGLMWSALKDHVGK